MKQTYKVILLSVFLALLLMSGMTGCKKSAPKEESAVARVGVLDLEQTIRAHARFNELEKLDQEIAKTQAEAARGGLIDNSSASKGQKANVAADTATGYQQVLEQQFSAQMSQKNNELGQVLKAKIEAEHQNMAAQMNKYAGELDKTYQPEILSAKLKLQTVQMTPEQSEAAKKELEALQAEREQKLQQKYQVLEQEAKSRIAQAEKNAAEQFRQYQAELSAQANSQMNEKIQGMKMRSAQMQAGVTMPAATQKYAAELKVLQEQRDKLRQIILKDIKDAAARVASAQNLEVVIVNYQQNIQGVDVTEAVIAEIKK